MTEIRNEGPDRVTGLTLVETTSANLELSYNSAVNGVSGNVATSFLDSLVRLPALGAGAELHLATHLLRAHVRAMPGAACRSRASTKPRSRRSPESEAAVTVQPAQADLELQFLDAPTVAQASIPTLVGVRVRNLGPAVATGVKVAVTVPTDALTLGGFGYGPRASIDLLAVEHVSNATPAGRVRDGRLLCHSNS